VSVLLHLGHASFVHGDANVDGVVNIGDATKVMRIFLGLDPITPGADANEDGVVNMGDVMRIVYLRCLDKKGTRTGHHQ
jgi:hypothetical protein